MDKESTLNHYIMIIACCVAWKKFQLVCTQNRINECSRNSNKITTTKSGEQNPNKNNIQQSLALTDRDIW